METVPGDERLVAFEEQVRADTASAEGSGTMDVEAFFSIAGDTGERPGETPV
ncbi:MAG: hypothetical protein ABJA87_06310 [bacterium]